MINYKDKYLKYKNKYIELKNNLYNKTAGSINDEQMELIGSIFGSKTKYRFIREIKLLEENGYDIDLSFIGLKKIIISKNNRKITIELPELFPIGLIKMFDVIQNKVGAGSGLLLLNYISELPKEYDSNVLIYCHERKYTCDDNDDYLQPYNMCETINKALTQFELTNPKIYTLDIKKKEKYSNPKHQQISNENEYINYYEQPYDFLIKNEPDILADGFCEDFINYFSSPTPIFDVVFMLDCSGPWNVFQGRLASDMNKYDNSTIDNDKIIEMINNVLKIIKINGKLMIGKILNIELYDYILNNIPNSFKSNDQFGHYVILIIKK
jgi:hypothetical protein